MMAVIRNILLSLFLVVASAAYGSVSSMDVTVSDASGKVAFKGATNANGTFATGILQPGNYVIQFNSKTAAVQGDQYLLVVSAGKKKVTALAVPGEKFTAGGVAMKVPVGAGLKITGQVVSGIAGASNGNPNVRVINGQRYLWIKPATGSNLGAHWEEEGLRPGQVVGSMSPGKLRQLQDRAGEGSMLNRAEPGHRHFGDL